MIRPHPGRSPIRRAILAGGAAALVAVLPATAGIPLRDAGGHPIRWSLGVEQPNVQGGAVTYYLSGKGASNEPLGDSTEQDAVDLAIAAWAAVPGTQIRLKEDPQRPATARNAKDRVNYISWQKFILGPFTLSATYSTASNGVLRDVDTVFNDQELFFLWATTTPGTQGYADIQSAATHELGHLMGLDHTPVALATMATLIRVGSIHDRTLKPDDVGAMLEAYPGVLDADHGTIYGRVVLGKKKKARGVPVFALDPATDEPAGCGMTTESGAFKILGLPPGDYLVMTAPLATTLPYSPYWEKGLRRVDALWFADPIEGQDAVIPRTVTVRAGYPSSVGVLGLRKPRHDGPGEPDDAMAKAREIPIGGAIVGAFERANDQDWYRFAATDSTPLDLRVLGWGVGSSADSDLAVFDATGTQVLASNIDVRPPIDTEAALGDEGVDLDPAVERFTPPAPGEYLVRVRAEPQSETGTAGAFYLLHIVPSPTPPAPAATR